MEKLFDSIVCGSIVSSIGDKSGHADLVKVADNVERLRRTRDVELAGSVPAMIS